MAGKRLGVRTVGRVGEGVSVFVGGARETESVWRGRERPVLPRPAHGHSVRTPGRLTDAQFASEHSVGGSRAARARG